jgi:hypothetical protein
MLSEPSYCFPDRERCDVHLPCPMMQILSLKLAEVSLNTNSVQLYGYIAVRDYLDSLLNYIVNRSRDNPITAQQVHTFTSRNISSILHCKINSVSCIANRLKYKHFYGVPLNLFMVKYKHFYFTT